MPKAFIQFYSTGTGTTDWNGNEYQSDSIKVSFDRRDFLDIREFACWDVERDGNSFVIKFSRSDRRWRTSGRKTRVLKFAQFRYTGHIFEPDYFWVDVKSEYVSRDEIHIRFNIEELKNIENMRQQEKKKQKEIAEKIKRDENLRLAIQLHSEGKNFTVKED